jgi:hypothetical protein
MSKRRVSDVDDCRARVILPPCPVSPPCWALRQQTRTTSKRRSQLLVRIYSNHRASHRSEAPSTEPTSVPIEYATSSVQLTVQQSLSGMSLEEYLSNQEAHDAVITTAVAEAMDSVPSDNVHIEAVRPGTPILNGLGHFLSFPEAFNFMPDASIRLTYTVRTQSFYTASELFSQLATAQDTGLLNVRLAENAVSRGVTSMLTTVVGAPHIVPLSIAAAVADCIQAALLVKSLLCFAVLALLLVYLSTRGGRSVGRNKVPPVTLSQAKVSPPGVLKNTKTKTDVYLV